MQFVKKNPDNVIFAEETVPEKPKKHTKLIRRLAVIGVLAVVLLSAFFLAGSKGWLSFERLALKGFDRGKKTIDENLPLSLNGLNVSSLDGMGYCFCVLDDLEYTIYSPEGNETVAFKHNMSAPVSVTSSRRALLYERGNYKLSVLSREGELFSVTTENTVISADMNEKNQIIAVTTGERELGNVLLYGDEGEKLLTWTSSDRYVVDAALSPDGKSFAVLLLSVKNGDVLSEVCFFETGKEQPSATFSFENETMFDLRFLKNGTYVCFGQNKTAFFNNSRMTGVFEHETSLAFFTVTENEAVLLLSPEAGETAYRGVAVNTTAEVTASFQAKDVSFITATESGDLLLSENGSPVLRRRNKAAFSEEKIGISSDAGDVLRLMQKDGRVLLLAVNGLYSAEKG